MMDIHGKPFNGGMLAGAGFDDFDGRLMPQCGMRSRTSHVTDITKVHGENVTLTYQGRWA